MHEAVAVPHLCPFLGLYCRDPPSEAQCHGNISIKISALDRDPEHIYAHSMVPFPTNDRRKIKGCLSSQNCSRA